MPLQQVVVPLTLAQGPDTKTDPKQVPVGKLLSLQNGTFISPGRIKKRNGYSPVSTSVLGGGSITAGQSIFTLGSRLLAHDGTNLFSYSDSESLWVKAPARIGGYHGTVGVGSPSVGVSVNLIAQWPFAPAFPDMTIHPSGLQCVAWENHAGAPGVYFTVIDSASGTQILAPGLIPVVDSSINQRSPKVMHVGQYIIIFFINGVSLYYTAIDTLNVNAGATTPTLVFGNFPAAASAHNYDVALINGKLVFASCRSDGNIQVNTLDSSRVGTTPIVFAANASGCITVFPGSNNQAVIAWGDGTTVFTTILTAALTAQAMSTSIVDVADAAQITGAMDFAGNAAIFWTVPAANPAFVQDYFIRTRSVLANQTGFTDIAADLVRSLGLAGKAFLNGQSVYALALHDSVDQPTVFLVDQTGEAVAKALVGASTGQPSGPTNTIGTTCLPEHNFSGGVAQYVLQSVLLTAPTTFNAVAFTFGAYQGRASLANTLHYGGGFMWMYDGTRQVEHGFHLFPEGISAPSPGGNQVYRYLATYEWTDSSGNIHISAPSPAITVAKGPTTNTTTVSTTTQSTTTTVSKAQVAFVNTAQTGSVSGTSCSVSLTLTAGNLVIVGVQWNDQVPSNANVTDNLGNVYSPTSTKHGFFTGALYQSMQLWYCPNVKGGTATITFSTVGSGFAIPFVELAAAQYSGVTTSGGVLDVTAFNQNQSGGFGGTNNVGISYTPSQSGELTVSYFSHSFNGGASVSGGFTVRGTNDMQWALADNTNTPTGSQSVTWTNPGGQVGFSQAILATFTSATIVTQNTVPTTQTTTVSTVTPAPATVVTIPTLRVTSKQDGAATGGGTYPGGLVRIVVYRTTNSGTIFYRCIPPSQYGDPINDPTSDYVSFLDTSDDATIVNNPRLYTTGGVLDNDPANPPSYMTQIKNRIWYIDSTHPSTLGFSKEVTPGAPVEFSAFLTFNLESRGGNAVALANLDEKIIVFKETAISWISGNGPADDGSQNDFVEIPIPTDVGCQDPASIATGGTGITFKTAKGFYLLDRSLNVTYIGADVEAFNSATVTSGQVLPRTNWILFTLNNGASLIFDYFVNQWSTYGNISAVDSAIRNGVLNYIDSSGVVHVETPGAFSDSGAYIPISFKTGWIQLSNLQGFQRVWRFDILGEWLSSHNLKVELAYDYDPTIVQTDVFDGSISLVPYQWRVDCARQQCQAVQITVTELQNGPVGEGLNISGINCEIGLKRGIWKVPASQTKG